MSQLAVVPELDKELDRLFELPPAEFTAARNDLAKRLKQTGQPEAAARVQALRKPTIVVWTVNQIGRRFADEVTALVGAGEELRKAQEAALAKGERERLREATAAEREAVRALTHRAHEILSAAGQRPTAAVVDRIATTIRAAALDPRGREALAAGRLTEELESSGFSAFEGMALPAASPPAASPRRKTGAAEERRRKERLRKLRERVRKLEADAADAERAAEEAETEAERARRRAEKAKASAERAREELASAEEDARE